MGKTYQFLLTHGPRIHFGHLEFTKKSVFVKRPNVHCTMYIEGGVYIKYKVGTQGGQRTGRREISGVELTGCCHVGATRAPRSAPVVIHIYSRDSVLQESEKGQISY